jgi:hypothetical protein
VQVFFSTVEVKFIHLMGEADKIMLGTSRGFELITADRAATINRQTPLQQSTTLGGGLAMFELNNQHQHQWFYCFTDGGMFCDSNGQPVSEHSLVRWISRPQSFHYQSPHLFCFDDSHSLIEVLDLSVNGRLVQVINLPSVFRHCSVDSYSNNNDGGGGGVYFSLSTSKNQSPPAAASHSKSKPQQQKMSIDLFEIFS